MLNGERERTDRIENANGTTTVRTVSEVFDNGILVIKNGEERIIATGPCSSYTPPTVPLLTDGSPASLMPASSSAGFTSSMSSSAVVQPGSLHADVIAASPAPTAQPVTTTTSPPPPAPAPVPTNGAAPTKKGGACVWWVRAIVRLGFIIIIIYLVWIASRKWGKPLPVPALGVPIVMGESA